jgi:hypothetical protein
MDKWTFEELMTLRQDIDAIIRILDEKGLLPKEDKKIGKLDDE